MTLEDQINTLYDNLNDLVKISIEKHGHAYTGARLQSSTWFAMNDVLSEKDVVALLTRMIRNMKDQ